jgi:hypothetical protein
MEETMETINKLVAKVMSNRKLQIGLAIVAIYIIYSLVT